MARDFEAAQDPLASPSHHLTVVRFEEEPSGYASDAAAYVESGEVREQLRDPVSLSAVIKERIRARTSERVRDLEVLCERGRIVLRGRCATFYTKQLAQHAAMGVVEDETLVNEVAVGIR